MKKRILLFTTRDFANIGGVERYIQNFTAYAARHEWPLTVLLNEGGKARLVREDSVQYVYYRDVSRRLGNFFRFLNQPLTLWALRKQLHPVLTSASADAVVTRDWNAVLLAKSVLKGVPVYFMPGSLVKMDMRFDNEKTGSVLYRLSRVIQSFIRVLMERWAFRRADRILVFSEWLRTQISRHYDIPVGKIVVLPMGINVRETSGNGSVEKGMILSVGRLAKSKNLCTAIAAMKEMDGYRLCIAGEGPERRSLEEQIRKMNLQDRVLLLGKQDDLSSYYHRCDVFMHLSYYENFGQVLLEAMLYGKPPIVLDPAGRGVHTASAELIREGHNGFFVANDPAAVRAKIREVAAMEKQPMEQNCRRFAGQFTFERHLEALGRLMEERAS